MSQPANYKTLAFCLSLGQFFMVWIAITSLTIDADLLANARNFVLAFLAGLTSYGINTRTLEGAKLYAKGNIHAGVFSTVLILACGGSIATFSLTGLIAPEYMQAELQSTGLSLDKQIKNENRKAQHAGKLLSSLRVTKNDLQTYSECEKSESCISHEEHNGYGPIARLLATLSARGHSIENEFARRDEQRQQHLTNINQLSTQFKSILGNTELTLKERRQKLSVIYRENQVALQAMSNALPVDLVVAYRNELAAGVDLHGRPKVAERLNTILNNHARGLTQVLGSMPTEETLIKPFPERPQMSELLRQSGRFIGLLMLILCVECLMPIGFFWIQAWKLKEPQDEYAEHYISKHHYSTADSTDNPQRSHASSTTRSQR